MALGLKIIVRMTRIDLRSKHTDSLWNTPINQQITIRSISRV